GGDLRELQEGRPGGGQGGAAAAEPAADGPAVRDGAGGCEGGAGYAGDVDRAVPVAGVGAGTGQEGEDAGGAAGGGADAGGVRGLTPAPRRRRPWRRLGSGTATGRCWRCGAARRGRGRRRRGTPRRGHPAAGGSRCRST